METGLNVKMAEPSVFILGLQLFILPTKAKWPGLQFAWHASITFWFYKIKKAVRVCGGGGVGPGFMCHKLAQLLRVCEICLSPLPATAGEP